jgi:hypothetical protein
MLSLCLLGLLASCIVGNDDPHATQSELAIARPAKLIALGGSITAGAGLEPHTTNSFTGRPRESAAAYPALMAKDQGLELVQAACSGATAANILPSSDHRVHRRYRVLFYAHQRNHREREPARELPDRLPVRRCPHA